MCELTANRTWIGWFLAIVIPGTIAEVGLQTHGLPLVYGFAFILFVLVLGIAVAEIMEMSQEFDDLEVIHDQDVQDDIHKELNGQE